MWKKFVLQLRYPYALGIITVIWFATLGFVLIDSSMLNWVTLMINILANIYVMGLGLVKK